MNHTITIAGNTIRQDEHGRYCLNDLHRAAGGEQKHRPSRWLRSQQTQDLMAEIEIAQIRAIETIQKTGTFGCRELVYCYAMWISPMFHLKVIRAYDALVTGQAAPQAPALPEVLRPADLDAMLDKPMQITVREYLALTQGKVAPQGAAQPPAAKPFMKFFTPEARSEIIRLANEGNGPATIAEIMNCNEDSVATILYRHRKALGKKGGAA